jgi:hypothetical protein
MKTIYTIYLNHDGLYDVAFSNKKALFDYIIKQGIYDNCRTIDSHDRKYRPFTYANLVKELSKYTRAYVNDGENSYNGQIEISTMILRSK